jgi:hypothetical protein
MPHPRLEIQLRLGENQPGDFLYQTPPGLRRLAPGDWVGDQWAGLCLTCQGALRIQGKGGVQSRIEGQHDRQSDQAVAVAGTTLPVGYPFARANSPLAIPPTGFDTAFERAGEISWQSPW